MNMRIVQHVAGEPGTGGPATALQRILNSRLSRKYDFSVLQQVGGAGPLNIKLLSRWCRYLKAVDPDLVHVRGLGNEGLHGVLAARLAGCPRILVSVHGTVRDLTGSVTLRRRVLISGAEPLTLKLATHVATVCQWGAGRPFIEGVRYKLAGVVPNGVDVQEPDLARRGRTRSELGIKPGQIVVIVVGRVTVEKGLLVLAEALKMIRHLSRIQLLVVGGGVDFDRVESAYNAVPGLQFKMLGPRSDVQALLEASDLFVFPTLHENLSNALLEGMAAGLPVVASSVGGNVEVLENGGGVLVPASNAVFLGEAIERFLEHPDLRAAAGHRALGVVRNHFSLEAMITGWESLYDSVLRTRV